MMKHATSLALHTYWLSRHGEIGVRAGGINAAELAPVLPHLFLLELGAAEGPKFRFCGAELARRYGRELQDELFLPLWTREDRDVLAWHFRAVSWRSAGLIGGVLAETLGGGFTSFELLILPLAGPSFATTGAIGTLVRVGGHDDANRLRARLVSQKLRSVRVLPTSPFNRTAPSGSDAATVQPSQVRRRYKHLMVVNGGR